MPPQGAAGAREKHFPLLFWVRTTQPFLAFSKYAAAATA
jgi:hypothetical protein